METQTVDPKMVSNHVRRVLDWYTQGFLTEKELIHLLERSMEIQSQRALAGSVPVLPSVPEGEGQEVLLPR